MTDIFIRRGADLTLYTPISGELNATIVTNQAISSSASINFNWTVTGTPHGKELYWRDSENYVNGGFKQFSCIDFEVDSTLYSYYSSGSRDTTYELMPYVHSGGTTPGWVTDYINSWTAHIDAYTSGSKYYFRMYFENYYDTMGVFPLVGDWVLRMGYWPTAVQTTPTYAYPVRICFIQWESGGVVFNNVHTSRVDGTDYTLTESIPQDSCYNFNTITWTYGTLGEGIICICTDYQTPQGPAVQKNGLWYVWSSGITEQIVHQSTTIVVTYEAYIRAMYYYLYDATTGTRTLTSLGEKQVGSSYVLPQNAGTCRTHIFDKWVYREVDYSGGATLISYPSESLVDSYWTGNTYTVNYSINPSAFCPSPIPTSASFTYPNTYHPLNTPSVSTWIVLPDNAITLDNYDYKGWSNDGGTTRLAGGTPYLPTENTTFVATFDPKEYTVKFYDYGQNTPLYTQTVSYPNTVSIPNTASVQGYTLKGWKKKNTYYDIIIDSNATSFQPTSNVVDLYQTLEVERVYQYTLSLYRRDAIGSRTHIVTRTASFPQTTQLPDSTSTYTDGKIPAGYDLCGWTTDDYVYSKDIAKSGTYTFTTQYTVVNNIVVLQAIPIYYMALTPKVLQSLHISSESINIAVGDTITAEVEVVPNDWLGTVEWDAQSTQLDPGTYVSLTPNGRRVSISTNSATGSDEELYLVVSAQAKTWEESTVISDSVRMRILALTPIGFYTKNPVGERIPFNNNRFDDDDSPTNVFYTVQNPLTGVWEWTDGPTEKDYPDENPLRTGYTFTGWVDADGNLVDANSPPTIPIEVDATWAETYVSPDRDSAYLQLFNFDSTRKISQFDLGELQSNTETFNTGISAMSTPTMTSVNTFITNMNCTESITIQILRKCPDIRIGKNDRDEDVILNDLSDNPLDWTNKKWITEIRKLIDRWQSATDGIKLLFIPRGMRIIQINGQYVGIGDNYDLLGYAKEFDDNGNNSGMLFVQDENGTPKTYVLTGYNGIISSYTDTYSATSNRVISVTFTVSLGGMKSKYQNWKDALVLLK